MNQSRCKACGAPIVWIKTRSGKTMPCDAKPLNYVVSPGAARKIVTPAGDVISCEITENPEDAAGFGYNPHWSTCPNADSFRRR